LRATFLFGYWQVICLTIHSNVNMPRLQLGLTDYFEFYNTERPHQSLRNLTPIQVYQTASGVGARIVDKFKERKAF
jgi:putative transposase